MFGPDLRPLVVFYVWAEDRRTNDLPVGTGPYKSRSYLTLCPRWALPKVLLPTPLVLDLPKIPFH